jgi:hypothetical protein
MPRVMTTTEILLASLGIGLGLAACEPSAVEAPSYVNDVRPILEANCARCHAYPSANGAPTGFRLDVFDDTTTDDGKLIWGAQSMAGYIAIRTGEGTMPPTFPLDDWQVETLSNWYTLAVADSERYPRPIQGARGDHPTAMTVTQSQDGDDRLIAYEIIDPDGDTVTGSLFAFPDFAGSQGYCRITDELHSGSGVIRWNTRTCPAGTYVLRAYLHDGDEGDEPPIDIETFTLEQPGNVPPTPVFLRPNRVLDEIIADTNGPFEVVLQVRNLEAEDTLSATIKAVRLDCPAGSDCPDQTIAIELPVDVIEPAGSVGFCNPEQMYLACRILRITWQSLKVDAGKWQLVATVGDGTSQREATSLPFVISHSTTDKIFGGTKDCANPNPTIACILQRSCAGPCHNGKRLRTDRRPGVALLDFDNYEAPEIRDYPGVNEARGLVYRRVCLETTMPPGSADAFATPDVHADSGFVPFSSKDYGDVCDWLRAGAPEN